MSDGMTEYMRKLKQKQVGGDHYRKMEIQPIEFIHRNGLGFIEGLAIKYIVRHREKGGREDLEKAVHCLSMLIDFAYGDNENDNKWREYAERERRPTETGEYGSVPTQLPTNIQKGDE